MVPRAAFTSVTGRLRNELSIPLITSNRTNMPDVAEEILAKGDADLVLMARPMLADSDLALKALQGREDEINTCIACNQACLDHTFTGKLTSCLVNPRAYSETEPNFEPTNHPKTIPVVGAGLAGLAYATIAAERGHEVTLFEASCEIGGQFNLARKIPVKEEFYETPRYCGRMITKHGVKLKTEHRVCVDDVRDFDHVVFAIGIKPRSPDIPGIGHKKVVRHIDAIEGRVEVGRTVAIIGAGGIGFDVYDLISYSGPSAAIDIDLFAKEWGID